MVVVVAVCEPICRANEARTCLICAGVCVFSLHVESFAARQRNEGSRRLCRVSDLDTHQGAGPAHSVQLASCSALCIERRS